MKTNAINLAILLGMTLLGCQDNEWKNDSCHVIQTEVCTCDTPKVQTRHWLETLQAMSAAKQAATLSPDVETPQTIETPQTVETQQTTETAADSTHQVAAVDSPRSPKPKLEKGNCVDINQADEKQLTLLPGVGPGRAVKIIQAREKKPFKRKNDITKVKGIGRKSYQKMSAFICDIPSS